MTRFGYLVLALVVCLVGVASADTDCNEAQFWKSLVTHKVSAAQLTSCHEVVSIVTFAREARCMQLVPATVCSYAQQYCPGIECSVSFTLLDEENVEENEQDTETEVAVEEEDAEEAAEENFEEEADIEEEIDEEFRARDTNVTKKEAKKQKKAEKKKAKEEKKAAKHQDKVEKHQRRVEAHNATAHGHLADNATNAHGHKVRHGKSKLTVAGEEEAIDADVSALDVDTMRTKLNASGPRPAPLLFLVFTLMGMVGVVALSVYRAKSRREGYRTLPDSGYL